MNKRIVGVYAGFGVLFLLLFCYATYAYNHNSLVRNPTVSQIPEPVVPAPLETPKLDELYQLVNDERVKAGVQPVSIDPRLVASASAKCADMVARNYWSHNTPEGQVPFELIRKFVPVYKKLGESLYYGNTTSRVVVDKWLASPSHKHNMLDGNFSSTGLGLCKSSNYVEKGEQSIVVQHFKG